MPRRNPGCGKNEGGQQIRERFRDKDTRVPGHAFVHRTKNTGATGTKRTMIAT